MSDQPRPTDSGAREGSQGGVSDALRTAVERTLENTGDPAGERLRATGDAARTVLDDLTQAGRDAVEVLARRVDLGRDAAAGEISRRVESAGKRVESAAQDVSRQLETSREQMSRQIGSAGEDLSRVVESAGVDIARRATGAREMIGHRGDEALGEATALVDRVIAAISRDSDKISPNPTEGVGDLNEGAGGGDESPGAARTQVELEGEGHARG